MYSPIVDAKMSKINNNLKELLELTLDRRWSAARPTHEMVEETKETFNQLVEHLNKTEFEVTLS